MHPRSDTPGPIRRRTQCRVAAWQPNGRDTLLEGFPELRDIVNGDLAPVELRKQTMLGSGTMLRVLAGVYFELKRADEGQTPLTESEIRDAFKALGPKLSEIPITEDNEFWISTGAFLAGGNAPSATQGALRSLTTMLVEWARERRPSLQRAA